MFAFLSMKIDTVNNELEKELLRAYREVLGTWIRADMHYP